MWRHQVDLAGGLESGDFSRLRFLAAADVRRVFFMAISL